MISSQLVEEADPSHATKERNTRGREEEKLARGRS